MTPDAWLTAAAVIALLIMLASGRVPADGAVVGVVVFLLICDVISPADALRGFANPGVVTVAALYVVAAGLKETGAIGVIAARFLGRPRTTLGAQARLIAPVAGLSAFINNTPIVAMFLPVIDGFARRTGIAPSRLYLPLSYAAILGGVCTLIGTSTNVVVAGLIRTHNAQAGVTDRLPTMGMFTITIVGLPVAIVGIAYMLAAGRRLLPAHGHDPIDVENARRYHVEMRVLPGSAIVGRTIEQAGLRHLPGLFLARIERTPAAPPRVGPGGERRRAGDVEVDAAPDAADEPGGRATIPAPGPSTVLLAGDTLVFVGVLESVLDLQKIRGLMPAADSDPAPTASTKRSHLKLLEAVISPSSPLVGRSVREGGFRTRYTAVIVAVHRHGHRLPGKIGDIVLRPGDTLLIEADPSFARRYKDSPDFHLVSELDGSAVPRHERASIALGVFAVLVVALTLSTMGVPGVSNWLPDEMTLALGAAVAMVILRCCSNAQARAALDWQVLIVIAASFGLGKAMENSGLAVTVADSLMAWARGGGTLALLATVYVVTLVFTSLLNNNAAAVLMFPIVLTIAAEQNLAPIPLLICMTLGASCEFITPLGYQTNLMVMGPGGYRWRDYLRYGGPLTLLCGVVAVLGCWMLLSP